ncbi:MAG TPA: hypothetical protein VKX24_00200 [Acidimicrobiia bacterium]|nr:hypothetical protein [Acidimicrobiia bacterium]
MAKKKKKRRPQPARGRPAQESPEESTPVAKGPVVITASKAVRIYSGLFGVGFFVLVVLNGLATKKVGLSAVPLLLVLLGAFVCLRIFRTSLVADQRGVTIRNYLKTYRLKWSDVGDFRLDPPVTRLEGWEMSVVRADGKPIRLDALRRPFVRNVESNRPILEAQRKRLMAWLR